MEYCENCGHEMPGDNFCGNCGKIANKKIKIKDYSEDREEYISSFNEDVKPIKDEDMVEIVQNKDEVVEKELENTVDLEIQKNESSKLLLSIMTILLISVVTFIFNQNIFHINSDGEIFDVSLLTYVEKYDLKTIMLIVLFLTLLSSTIVDKWNSKDIIIKSIFTFASLIAFIYLGQTNIYNIVLQDSRSISVSLINMFYISLLLAMMLVFIIVKNKPIQIINNKRLSFYKTLTLMMLLLSTIVPFSKFLFSINTNSSELLTISLIQIEKLNLSTIFSLQFINLILIFIVIPLCILNTGKERKNNLLIFMALLSFFVIIINIIFSFNILNYIANFNNIISYKINFTPFIFLITGILIFLGFGISTKKK